MFKLVVLFACIAVTVARPGLYETPAVVYSAPAVAAATYTVQEPALAKVGAVVRSVPTAVSHQSQTVVHNSAHVVQDVVAPVAVRTTAYTAPAATTYAAAHLPYTTAYVAAPVTTNLAASSPLTYTATGYW